MSDYVRQVRQRDSERHFDLQEENGHFKSFFICTGAARNAFTNLRPFGAADGTFTKSRFAHTLLLLCGMDADGRLILLAWAIFGSECEESWTWFFDQCTTALPGILSPGCTLISGGDKGLLNARATALPNVRVGSCCFHVAQNVQKY